MIATPHNKAGEIALAIYADVLEAVRADNLVRASVRLEGSALHVQDLTYDLDRFERVLVCGSGKASFAMGVCLAAILGERLSGGLIVTKHGHGGTIPGVEVSESSHPVPDETSLEAGRRMLEFARGCGEGDLVLYALSGGTSALMEWPLEGVTMDEIRLVTETLLCKGADIRQINAVRSALSATKQGRLGEAFVPAKVVVLVVSDVMGGALESIGSGPFWNSASDEWIPMAIGAGNGHFAASASTAAYTAARTFSLDNALGFSISDRLRHAAKAAPPLGRFVVHRYVGSSMTAFLSASKSARSLGLRSLNDSSSRPFPPKGASSSSVDEGDLTPEQWYGLQREQFLELQRESPRRMTEMFESLHRDTRAEAARVARVAFLLARQAADYVLFDGEPTVVIRGPGLGGRCQELACAAAPLIAGHDDLAILAGSTDGTDGPTDVAGALVDGGSDARARANGVTAEDALSRSDSNAYLAACGGLIKTGPTQSNVNDIVIVVRSAP